jgi:hypothetical protein
MRADTFLRGRSIPVGLGAVARVDPFRLADDTYNRKTSTRTSSVDYANNRCNDDAHHH